MVRVSACVTAGCCQTAGIQLCAKSLRTVYINLCHVIVSAQSCAVIMRRGIYLNVAQTKMFFITFVLCSSSKVEKKKTALIHSI